MGPREALALILILWLACSLPVAALIGHCVLGGAGRMPPLKKLTAAKLAERALRYAAIARNAPAADVRAAFERLAVRYTKQAAKRKAEEMRHAAAAG